MSQDRLKEKDNYSDLTPKQQAVVDAKVEAIRLGRDIGRNKLAKDATQILQKMTGNPDQSVSSSYVPVVMDSYDRSDHGARGIPGREWLARRVSRFWLTFAFTV